MLDSYYRRKLASMSENVLSIRRGGRFLIKPREEFLSTHPTQDKRADSINNVIPEALILREDNCCPLLSRVDPRVVFEEKMNAISRRSEEEKKSDQRRVEAEIMKKVISIPIPSEPPIDASMKN